MPAGTKSDGNALFRLATLLSWFLALFGLVSLLLTPAIFPMLSRRWDEPSALIVGAVVRAVLPTLSLVAAVVALYGALRRHIGGIAARASAALALSAAILLWDGLATKSSLQDAQLPVVFAAQIAGADRVVLWDRARLDYRSITGAQARAIVQAISTARGGERLSMAASYGRTLEFYRETNLLGSARIQRSLIKTEHGEFIDRSKVIDALDRSFPNEADQMTGVHRLVSDVRRNTELRALPGWVRSLSRAQRKSLENGDRLPDWLSTNWMKEPRVSFGDADDFMMLDWAGSAGILVCSGPRSANFPAQIITNAVPGVYVYHWK